MTDRLQLQADRTFTAEEVRQLLREEVERHAHTRATTEHEEGELHAYLADRFDPPVPLPPPIPTVVTQETASRLFAIAREWGVEFTPMGSVGIGRACVGFLDATGTHYVDFNPLVGEEYKPLWGYDDRLVSPDGVEGFHKHDCLAVLAPDEDYERAALGLLKWVDHLKAQGEVEIVRYDTQVSGLQAIISGRVRWAIRFKGGPQAEAAR